MRKKEACHAVVSLDPGLLAIALLGACRATPPLPEPVATAATAPTAAAPGWWNDSVFYEVFVRSFADSTTGPLASDGIGDLPGLIERLDYLNDGDPDDRPTSASPASG